MKDLDFNLIDRRTRTNFQIIRDAINALENAPTITASNVGTGGVGVFDAKVSGDLQFRNINQKSNKVDVTFDVANKEIDIDIVPSNIDHGDLNAASLLDDDHTQYLLADGTRSLSGDWDTGASRTILTDKIKARSGSLLKMYNNSETGNFKGICISANGELLMGTETTVGGTQYAIQVEDDFYTHFRLRNSSSTGVCGFFMLSYNGSSDDYAAFQLFSPSASGSILGQSRSGLMAWRFRPYTKIGMGTENSKPMFFAINNTLAGFIDTSQGLFWGCSGMGTAATGKMHVQQLDTSGAKPVVTVEQKDVSEEFIRYRGTAASADVTQSIVNNADVSTATIQGWIKCFVHDDGNQVTDQRYYIPFYSLT